MHQGTRSSLALLLKLVSSSFSELCYLQHSFACYLRWRSRLHTRLCSRVERLSQASAQCPGPLSRATRRQSSKRRRLLVLFLKTGRKGFVLEPLAHRSIPHGSQIRRACCHE
eukprot:76093-Rhodomonas_salina.2